MFIVSTGMVCPVGLSAAAACAAMRAGISMFQQLRYLDNRGEPIVGAVVPELEPQGTRADRLTKMATSAITECLRRSPQRNTREIPLLIGLAEERPGAGADVADSFVPVVQDMLGMRFHPEHSQAVAKGHTSGFEALKTARELMNESGAPGCLICGVDSYINASALAWLEQSWRLKTDDHSNGIIPGEAAAAVFVQPLPPEDGAQCVTVTGLGIGYEKSGILLEEPVLGLGLLEAARTALAEAGRAMQDVGFRLSDVTGEDYGFKEHALMVARLLRAPRTEMFPFWHAADSIGDTGAAAGVCQLVQASYAFSLGYAPGPVALCVTSSIGGRRAAAVLESVCSGCEDEPKCV